MEQPKANPEMSINNTNTMPDKSGGSKAWMIIAIIAILALIGLGIYGFMNMRTTNAKIKDQQSQIDSLQNTRQTLEAAAAAASTAATEAAAKAVTNVVAPSDSSQVSTLAKNVSEASVGNILDKNFKLGTPDISSDKNFASVSTNSIVNGQNGPGGVMVFKKVNGTWVFIATVQQMTPEFRSQYGFPNGF